MSASRYCPECEGVGCPICHEPIYIDDAVPTEPPEPAGLEEARKLAAAWVLDSRSLPTGEEQLALLSERIAAALEAAERRGRVAERAECAKVVDAEISDTTKIDWGAKRDVAVTVRSWLMNAAACIRARGISDE